MHGRGRGGWRDASPTRSTAKKKDETRGGKRLTSESWHNRNGNIRFCPRRFLGWSCVRGDALTFDALNFIRRLRPDAKFIAVLKGEKAVDSSYRKLLHSSRRIRYYLRHFV